MSNFTEKEIQDATEYARSLYGKDTHKQREDLKISPVSIFEMARKDFLAGVAYQKAKDVKNK